MSGAGIALDGGDVVGNLRSVRLRIRLAAAATVFFVHPGDHAQRAARANMQSLQNLSSRHRDDHTRAIVNRAAPQVPGIEMAGDDDDLLRMLAPLQIGDYVVTSQHREAFAE